MALSKALVSMLETGMFLPPPMKEDRLSVLHSLIKQPEASQSVPWKPTDAPAKFLGQQIKGIVGVEIKVSRFQGKWKISQNKNAADKSGVVAGLRDVASEDAMADLVRQP